MLKHRLSGLSALLQSFFSAIPVSCRAGLVPALLLGCSGTQAQPPVSGQPLGVATDQSVGPLSLGRANKPVGAAFVTGGKRPDLFVATGRHSSKPSLYLLQYLHEDSGGAPVFAKFATIPLPAEGKGKTLANGCLWQDAGSGEIYALWLDEQRIIRTRFDKRAMRFEPVAPPLDLAGLKRKPAQIAVFPQAGGALDIILSQGDGASYAPPDEVGWRDKDYRPYDAAFIYRGKLPYQGLYHARLENIHAKDLQPVKPLPGLEREALLSFAGLTPIHSARHQLDGLLGGTGMGMFHYYPRNPQATPLLTPPARYAADATATAIRHPIINASPVAYPDADGAAADFVAGGEGTVYYYRFSGKTTPAGAPVYAEPTPVLLAGATLFAGTLPVISTGDLNGDGLEDIIAGNSEGKVLFFANSGSNEVPRFAPGVQIGADGEPIHIQQGYTAVQGPQELRWGYACPRLFDWDGDGVLDLLVGTPRHGSLPDLERGLPQALGRKGATVLFLKNMGSNEAPSFARPNLMKFKSAPMYFGGHACSPAATMLGDSAGGPNLLVGDQEGRIFFFARKDLTWTDDDTPPRPARAPAKPKPNAPASGGSRHSQQPPL